MNKARHTLIALSLIGMLWLTHGQQLQAQGRSIPQSSETKATSTEELLDELPEGQKYRYPLLNGLNISVDLFDPLMQVFSVDHASYEAQVMLDLHHRFFPMASFGMGWADERSNNGIEYDTGEKQELTYKSDLAPFAKIGIAYNLQYNDIHPEDFYLIFARYGWAHNTADITNLYYADKIWGAFGPLELKDQSYTTQWIEFGGMIKVQIYKKFSLGWDLYWKVKLNQSGTQFGTPYYVPGMGTSNSSIGCAFRLYYDIF